MGFILGEDQPTLPPSAMRNPPEPPLEQVQPAEQPDNDAYNRFQQETPDNQKFIMDKALTVQDRQSIPDEIYKSPKAYSDYMQDKSKFKYLPPEAQKKVIDYYAATGSSAKDVKVTDAEDAAVMIVSTIPIVGTAATWNMMDNAWRAASVAADVIPFIPGAVKLARVLVKGARAVEVERAISTGVKESRATLKTIDPDLVKPFDDMVKTQKEYAEAATELADIKNAASKKPEVSQATTAKIKELEPKVEKSRAKFGKAAQRLADEIADSPTVKANDTELLKNLKSDFAKDALSATDAAIDDTLKAPNKTAGQLKREIAKLEKQVAKAEPGPQRQAAVNELSNKKYQLAVKGAGDPARTAADLTAARTKAAETRGKLLDAKLNGAGKGKIKRLTDNATKAESKAQVIEDRYRQSIRSMEIEYGKPKTKGGIATKVKAPDRPSTIIQDKTGRSIKIGVPKYVAGGITRGGNARSKSGAKTDTEQITDAIGKPLPSGSTGEIPAEIPGIKINPNQNPGNKQNPEDKNKGESQPEPAVKQETKTEIKERDQTKPKEDAEPKEPILPKLKPGTKVKIEQNAVPKIKTPIDDDSAINDQRNKDFAGAVAWKQGAVIFAVKAPYKSKDDVGVFSIKNPPAGLKMVRNGHKSAFRSIQTITGEAPSNLMIDMGIMDVKISRPTKEPGEQGAIKFLRDPGQRTNNVSVKRHSTRRTSGPVKLIKRNGETIFTAKRMRIGRRARVGHDNVMTRHGRRRVIRM